MNVCFQFHTNPSSSSSAVIEISQCWPNGLINDRPPLPSSRPHCEFIIERFIHDSYLAAKAPWGWLIGLKNIMTLAGNKKLAGWLFSKTLRGRSFWQNYIQVPPVDLPGLICPILIGKRPAPSTKSPLLSRRHKQEAISLKRLRSEWVCKISTYLGRGTRRKSKAITDFLAFILRRGPNGVCGHGISGRITLHQSAIRTWTREPPVLMILLRVN